MSSDLEQEILLVISQEREALLAGDFEQVAGLGRRKEKATRGIQNAAMERPTVVNIMNEINRSQGILSAAINGVKAAQASLDIGKKDGLRNAVYTQEGRRSCVRHTESTTTYKI